jgi:hypothetical protein
MTNVKRTLRVIEPNLVGPSGHYAEWVRAVAARRGELFGRIEVDASARFAGMADLAPGVELRPTFEGSSCTAEWAEIRRALAAGGPFVVLTANALQAAALEAIALLDRRPDAALRNVRLFFHWREQARVRRVAAAMAPRTRRNSLAIAPTSSIAAFLRETGWQRVREVPYPALAPAAVPPARAHCTHLLVAGAARMNKGLPLIADLAERLGRTKDPMRLVVQTTPKRASGRRGSKEETELARLMASGAPGLEASDTAPPSHEYGARFDGALTLAPYDAGTFADAVSGIVLDALLRGSPCIATADTWPGRLVERFGAGATFPARSTDAFADAVARTLADWPAVAARAQAAARVLAQEHDPVHLVRTLAEE